MLEFGEAVGWDSMYAGSTLYSEPAQSKSQEVGKAHTDEAPATPRSALQPQLLSNSRDHQTKTQTPNSQKTPWSPSQGALQLNPTNQPLYNDGAVIQTSKHSAQQKKMCM
jgi:hypothetical protein